MINIKNVSKWYSAFQVLTDCSAEVKKGEVVVVCGPSGRTRWLSSDHRKAIACRVIRPSRR